MLPVHCLIRIVQGIETGRPGKQNRKNRGFGKVYIARAVAEEILAGGLNAVSARSHRHIVEVYFQNLILRITPLDLESPPQFFNFTPYGALAPVGVQSSRHLLGNGRTAAQIFAG